MIDNAKNYIQILWWYCSGSGVWYDFSGVIIVGFDYIIMFKRNNICCETLSASFVIGFLHPDTRPIYPKQWGTLNIHQDSVANLPAAYWNYLPTRTRVHMHIEREMPQNPRTSSQVTDQYDKCEGTGCNEKERWKKGGEKNEQLCVQVWKGESIKVAQKKRRGKKKQWRMRKSHTSPSNILLLMTFSFPHLFPPCAHISPVTQQN